MANTDTQKGIGVTGVAATNANKEVIAEVPDMVWTKEERDCIRAIALALTTSRKPVSTDDVVTELKRALQAKAKSTFYAPFETEWKNHETVVRRDGGATSKEDKAKYMHRFVQPSGWTHMVNVGCKLDILPPKAINPADSPATSAAVAATVASDEATK